MKDTLCLLVIDMFIYVGPLLNGVCVWGGGGWSYLYNYHLHNRMQLDAEQMCLMTVPSLYQSVYDIFIGREDTFSLFYLSS